MLQNKDYEEIIFALAVRYLKKKDLLADFLSCSYQYHSVNLEEYKLPKDLSPKEKTKRILGHNVKKFIKSDKFYPTPGDELSFISCVENFFVTYEGSFDWCESGMEDIWYAFNHEWEDGYVEGEINKLVKKGLQL
jgi:hypothetical protein